MSLELATEALRIVSTGSCQQEPMDLAVDQAELEASLKARFTTEAVVILWQRSRIIWGRCQDECLKIAGDLSLDLNQTLELRVFNEEEELHLKRQENRLIGRWIQDKGGDTVEYVDSLSRFWGSRKQELADGYALLEDTQRKLQLRIPVEEEAEYYGLVTRNYIQTNEVNGQAGYGDYRFLRITSADAVKGGHK